MEIGAVGKGGISRVKIREDKRGFADTTQGNHLVEFSLKRLLIIPQPDAASMVILSTGNAQPVPIQNALYHILSVITCLRSWLPE